MGMFDYVDCELPLPDGWKGKLQTRDFDCPYLETYTIRADGRLIHRETRKTFGVDVDTNFHGILNFYGLENDEWHEYNAKFTDGQLVSISIVSDGN